MRITDRERAEILRAVLKVDPEARVYLHGSRARDDLRGGDIDLLVLSDKIGFSEKVSIGLAIKQSIGDQKIDITVSGHSAQDPFVLSILNGAVPLN